VIGARCRRAKNAIGMTIHRWLCTAWMVFFVSWQAGVFLTGYRSVPSSAVDFTRRNLLSGTKSAVRIYTVGQGRDTVNTPETRNKMGNFTRWNNWLGRRMYLFVLLALGMGFMTRLKNTPAVWMLIIALFAYMTFITALETSFRQFIDVLSRPWIPVWILFLVHVVTPLIAWILGYLFFPDDLNIRLGYLIGAVIPVGVTSIIWTSLLRGNVAVSLVTVSIDALVAPVLLPLFFLIAIGRAIQINYFQMTVQLLVMITIPSIAGMILHDYSGKRVVGFAKGLGGLSSKLVFYLMVYINAAVVAPMIIWSMAVMKMLLVTLLMVLAAYLTGYLGGFITKHRSRENTVAILYNVGLRNISAGLVLALTHFSVQVAVPITLYILFQQPLASLAPYLFRLTDRSVAVVPDPGQSN